MTRLSSASSRNHKILFIDDEEKTLKYFLRAFEPEFNILTASNARQAIQILETNPEIAILITDQRMPGDDGVSLLKMVKARHPDIIRILTTAYSDLDSAIQAVNSGEIFRYITKPWDLDLLRHELKTALEFYCLRQERDFLLREKMNVWQRMEKIDLIRGISVISSCLPWIKNTDQAVISFSDGIISKMSSLLSGNMSTNLWERFQAETQDIMEIARKIASDTCNAGDDINETVDLGKLLAPGFDNQPAPASGHIIYGNHILLEQFCTRVNLLDKENPNIVVSRKINHQDNDNITININIGSFDDSMSKCIYPLLEIYFIVYHHGGLVSATVTNDYSIGLEIQLPAQAETASAQEPSPGWLGNLLERYENYSY